MTRTAFVTGATSGWSMAISGTWFRICSTRAAVGGRAGPAAGPAAASPLLSEPPFTAEGAAGASSAVSASNSASVMRFSIFSTCG